MGVTGHKGIDIRQSGNRLIADALLLDSAGDVVTTGTTSLFIYELQDDGTIKSYDFTDNTFKSTALTTPSASMTHRTGNNGATNTGIWTYVLSTLTGFTSAALYYFVVTNTNASPPRQARKFQYGDGVLADLRLYKGSTPADLADTDKLPVSVQHMADNVITAAAAAADFGAEIAALVETYIVNEGDATAVMQAIANLIAADWVAGDASPLAIIAAFKADATLATMISNIDATISSRLASAGYTAPLDAAGTRSAVGLATNNLDTQLGNIVTDTNELQLDWMNGGRLDLLIDAIKAVTDALTAASAAKLAASAGQIILGTVDNSAHTPTATEFEADNITEATADHYNGRMLIFTSGALAGQATAITDYALAGSNGHFTVTALTEAPANDDTFVIV